MITTFCNSFECPDGNCEGCKGGKLWCDDPRCYPYCRACELPKDHNTIMGLIMFVMIFVFLIIAIVLFISFGPRILAFKGDDGEEYTYITSFDV